MIDRVSTQRAHAPGRVGARSAVAWLLVAAALAGVARHGSGHAMADNVTDLGGVVVDLEGGDYLISAPITVPPMYGNIHFTSGTIRTSVSFPKGSYLVEVGAQTCAEHGQGCCHEPYIQGIFLLERPPCSRCKLSVDSDLQHSR